MNHRHLILPLPGHWMPEQALAVWEPLEIICPILI